MRRTGYTMTASPDHMGTLITFEIRNDDLDPRAAMLLREHTQTVGQMAAKVARVMQYIERKQDKRSVWQVLQEHLAAPHREETGALKQAEGRVIDG